MADEEDLELTENTEESAPNFININLMGAETIVSETNTQAVVTPEDVDSRDTSSIESARRRMRHTTYQSRMGRKMDKISRRLIDNSIRLTSTPMDMLRIKVKRDGISQDLVSRTIISSEVVSIVFPKIEGIPMRHLKQTQEGYIVPSLIPVGYEGQQSYFEIYCPMALHLDEDDLLFRVIFDEASDRDYVMALQVKETLGNIGVSSLRMVKYWVTLYDEKLPPEIVNTIIRATNKREALQW